MPAEVYHVGPYIFIMIIFIHHRHGSNDKTERQQGKLLTKNTLATVYNVRQF